MRAFDLYKGILNRWPFFGPARPALEELQRGHADIVNGP
jgi:hypothetical protein